MGITRGPLSADNFTVAPNHWARTDRLSYKAKGLLLAIASHSAGYRLTIKQLIAESNDGKDAIRAGLAELEAAGYLRRVRIRDTSSGRLGHYEWTLVEDPNDEAGHRKNPGHQGGKPDLGSDQGFSNETAGRDQSQVSRSGSDQGVHPVSAGQNQSAESAPKKTKEEDQSEKTKFLGGRSPQTPPPPRSAQRRQREWRPRIPQAVKNQGPAAVAEYTQAITDERTRLKDAVTAGVVPF